MQETRPSTIERSRQAWLQAMQTLTGSPWRARAISCPSARKGRAIEMKSIPPSANRRSAIARRLMRLPAITGTVPTARLRACAQGSQAPGGTSPWTVGTAGFVPADADVQRVDARPGELDREVRGFGEARRAGHQVDAREAEDQRHLGPTAARTARTSSTPKRILSPWVPAPVVLAPVRERREELIDQVALGAHQLDRVEAERAPAARRRARSPRSSPRSLRR